ncbi:MAG: ABC-2 type transport system permease protein [Sphingobacteriales bacterium]|jgi:ABC-2 type transport system permease protein
MLAIYKKEIAGFLSSFTAYIIIGVFLLVMGLFMWVFPDTNALDYGYATLDGLFDMAPWVFMFLVPAVTMRSFSEEKKQGTIELLATRPLSDIQIILGKYFANLTLVLFALIPTLVYYFSIYQLGLEPGNIDSGGVLGSYIGLFLLGAAFVAIGIFSSSITENQIVAFTLAVFISFFCFMGFEYISSLTLLGSVDYLIQWLGINAHYESISRGVLDTRDVIYFVGLVSLFLAFTRTVLGSRKW